ncbi:MULTISPECIES: sensor histidine kinase [unclassified Aureispira]|uniref:sensor histidine kinase n=1 Tax=unclassified Aureispira TaxID=2649989 RepID=UPI0006977430|nr:MULTISPECIES: histidine kinase [unclassified Aureispira]WMX14314.1 histidine kinase [Aureispira sp. CCB-E]
MKQQTIILIHIILWLLFVLPISCTSIVLFKLYPELIWSFYPEATMHYVLTDALYNTLSFGISFYLFYFFVFKWLFRSSNLLQGIAKTLVLFVMLFLSELLIIQLFYPTSFTEKDFLLGAEITLFIWLLFRLGLSMGAKGFVEYIQERTKRKELEHFNFQSELSLFRAQINPHFLFNTLNNIDALIYTNPDKASETLIQLSKQMRYLLHDSNVEKIALTEEIQFIRNYIDLETIRIKNKHFVHFAVVGKPQGIRIAPMLFIAFVENAFKHSSDRSCDAGLQVSFSITEDALLFQCKNRYKKRPTVEKMEYSGIGLDLVKKRLNLIYNSNYNLSIHSTDDWYVVQLEFPLTCLR